MNVSFFSSREVKKYVSFVALPLMNYYTSFASLDEINGIFITKNEYPL